MKKMTKEYKIAFFLTFFIVFIIGFIIFNKSAKNYTKIYKEVITELEVLYGENRDFKIINIIGKEIDERDYRPEKCIKDETRNSIWLGKFYKDAILQIEVKNNEVSSEPVIFDVMNNICMIKNGYADRFVIGIEAEHQLKGTIVNVYDHGSGLVVKPDTTEKISKKTEQIYVPSRVNVDYEVGMRVIVYYDGEINTEAIPSRMNALDVIIENKINSKIIEELSLTKKIIIKEISKENIIDTITDKKEIDKIIKSMTDAEKITGTATTEGNVYVFEMYGANNKLINKIEITSNGAKFQPKDEGRYWFNNSEIIKKIFE